MSSWNKQTVSVCMVVYNEEKVLGRCLNSLWDVTDEIVIVHDGPCSDETISIAESYGAKVFIRHRLTEASGHRPFTISKASKDWVWIIDADEYLSEKLRDKIKVLVNEENVNAYSFSSDVYWNGKLITKGYYSKAPRLNLFRKNKIVPGYLGRLHEFPTVSGKVEHSGLKLHHDTQGEGYSWKAFKSKSFLWARLEARQIIDYDEATMPYFFYLLKSPLNFVHHFIKLVRLGSFGSGIPGVRLTFLDSLYYFLISWNIFIFKK